MPPSQIEFRHYLNTYRYEKMFNLPSTFQIKGSQTVVRRTRMYRYFNTILVPVRESQLYGTPKIHNSQYDSSFINQFSFFFMYMVDIKLFYILYKLLLLLLLLYVNINIVILNHENNNSDLDGYKKMQLILHCLIIIQKQ